MAHRPGPRRRDRRRGRVLRLRYEERGGNAAGREPPERRHDHDRRPDRRVAPRNGERALAAREPGRHVRQQLCVLSALLPVARHLPDRAVRPQPPCDGQRRAERRLRQARPYEHASRLAAARRVRNRPHRQVPERLRTRAPDRDPTGLGRVVRLDRPVDVPVLQLHGERERQARPLRSDGRRLPGRRVHAAGRRRHPALRRRPAALCSFQSPTSLRIRAARATPTTRRTSRRPRPRRATATSSRASRC